MKNRLRKQIIDALRVWMVRRRFPPTVINRVSAYYTAKYPA